jgi:hypothetical protein
MTEALTAIAFLDRLADRGRRLQSSLDAGAAGGQTMDAMRRWQSDVASTVNELSGGSKAHWLSKAFSAAFLIATPASADRELLVEAPPTEIVARLLDVIAQARMSLTQLAAGIAPAEPSPPRRFEFVHDGAIRSVLEHAYVDGVRALESGDPERAFMTFCSVLEAIITDGIRDSGFEIRGDTSDVSRLSFDERIAAAEAAGLIRGGCARLPASARRYRDRSSDAAPLTIRDAEVVRQVLHVVMRDLDPGR